MKKTYKTYNTFDSLPKEMVAHIGSYITNPHDYNVCYQVAKCFDAVKYNARTARFSMFPKEEQLRVLFTRRPSLKHVSFSSSAFSHLDAEAASHTLLKMKETYGENFQFIMGFSNPYDVTTLIEKVGTRKCNVVMYLSGYCNPQHATIPMGLEYLELNLHITNIIDTPDRSTGNIRSMLPHCNKLTISNGPAVYDEHVVDLSCLTEKTKVRIEMDKFPIVMKPLQKSHIDVLHLELYGYMPSDLRSKVDEFYADPVKHLAVKELVISKMYLPVIEFEEHYNIYQALRYVQADTYIFVQKSHQSCIFHPLLVAYLKNVNKMDIVPLHKVHFMCLTRDDVITARIIQILLGQVSTSPTLFVPYLPNQPYTSLYERAWQPFNHFYGVNPVSQQDYMTIQNIHDIKQLYGMIEHERVKLLWSVVDT